MSNSKNNKSTYKKTKISLGRLILLLIIMLVVGRIIYGLAFRQPKTEIVKYGNIELSQKAKGYLIKNETVIQAPLTGQLQKTVQEGKKVKKGISVASVIKTDHISTYAVQTNNFKDEMKDIQNNIDNSTIFENDIIKIDTLIKGKLDEVTLVTSNGEIQKLSKIKSEINELMNKKSAITSKKGFTANTSEQTSIPKENNNNNSSKVDVPTGISGILSYNIDGYEIVLTPQNIDNLSVESLEKIDQISVSNNKDNMVTAGQPMFKLIDNFEWYIACVLKKSEIEPLEVNNNIYLELDKTIKIPAKVHSINMNNNNDKVIIVFSLTNNLEQYYNNRKMDITIIKRNYEGIKIPLSSIVKKDDKTNGVLLVDNGITKFKEVDILGSDDKYAIVVSENELSTKKGLSMYNQIIIKPSKVKEGVLLK